MSNTTSLCNAGSFIINTVNERIDIVLNTSRLVFGSVFIVNTLSFQIIAKVKIYENILRFSTALTVINVTA